ncbi:Unknown protein, partial [Striga hermonthica]
LIRHQQYCSVSAVQVGTQTKYYIVYNYATMFEVCIIGSISAQNGRRSILGSSGPNLPTRVCTWCPVLVFAGRCSVISYVTYVARSDRYQLSVISYQLS